MASRSESGKMPGTSFAGTLAANGLTPSVPGMASPGVLGPVGVSVCGSDVTDPVIKTAASRKMQRRSQLSLKEGLLHKIDVSKTSRAVSRCRQTLLAVFNTRRSGAQ
jgi:hypothetical protein